MKFKKRWITFFLFPYFVFLFLMLNAMSGYIFGDYEERLEFTAVIEAQRRCENLRPQCVRDGHSQVIREERDKIIELCEEQKKPEVRKKVQSETDTFFKKIEFVFSHF